MKTGEIREFLLELLIDYLSSVDRSVSNLNYKTSLVGENSVLDSIGLVNFIVDIEACFLDRNIEIMLTSEQAMSRKHSPFRTLETLSDYILEQIKGNCE
jgi:acyl carrier protein